MPLQREHARDLLRGGRAGVARDEVQHQVVPGRRRARADQLLAQPGDHEHALRMDRHGRIRAPRTRARSRSAPWRPCRRTAPSRPAGRCPSRPSRARRRARACAAASRPGADSGPSVQPSGRSSTDGTITMSLASMVSIARCTLIGTPLASSSGPTASPTISTWNGAARRRGRQAHAARTRSSRRRCRPAWRPPHRAAPRG